MMRKYSVLMFVTFFLVSATRCTKDDPGRYLTRITCGTTNLGYFNPVSQKAYKRPEGYILQLTADTITFTMLIPDWKTGDYNITNEPFPDAKAIFNIDFKESSYTAASGSVTITEASNTSISGIYYATTPFAGFRDPVKISNGRFKNVQLESIEYGSVEDREHNKYRTVGIGTQIWMAENLKSRIYADGDSIKEVYRYSNNDDLANIYGLLYTFNSATHNVNTEMTQGACPAGWHLPSNAEWKLLIDNLGGEAIAGGKLKSLISWVQINKGADNSSGFSSLSAGMHYPVIEMGDLCERMGSQTFYLSSTLDTTINGISSIWAVALNSPLREVWRYPYFRGDMGYSVRCIKN